MSERQKSLNDKAWEELFEKYEDVGIVLMVYHGEKDAATKTELSDYADWILTRSAELERMNGK